MSNKTRKILLFAIFLLVSFFVFGLEQSNTLATKNIDNSNSINISIVIATLTITYVTIFIIFVIVFLGIFRKNEKKRFRMYSNFISYVCTYNDFVTEYDFQNMIEYSYSLDNNRIKSTKKKNMEIKDLINNIHPEDRFKVQEVFNPDKIEENFDLRKVMQFDARRIMPDGTYHFHKYKIQFTAQDTEHPKNIIIFRRDIQSDMLKEEQSRQAFRDAMITAQQAATAKSTFTTKISHEIRSPLNAVIGYITIAQTNKNREKIMDCLAKSKIAAKHLLAILNDVLDLSAIENNKMKINHEKFDFRQLVVTVTDMFYTQAKEKNIKFEIILKNIKEEVLIGDQLRVNQILINLLSNAMKFTPENGNVNLIVNQVAEKKNKVYIQFEVKDNGIGMSKEFINKAFTPFERQDYDNTQVYGGTGLGLSITKNLVTMMNGTINVESEEGKGSSFIVELGFEKWTGKEQGAQVESLSQLKALVVCNESSVGEYNSILLKRSGIKSILVDKGNAVLEKLKKAEDEAKAINICLIDWTQIDINGYKLLTDIRNSYFGKEMIIIITAYDYLAVEEKLKNAGANYVIAKPLFQSTLFNILVNSFGNYIENKRVHFDFNGKHILVVEDNKMNMEITVNLLENTGITVDCASNGKIAVDKFYSHPEGYYDAILMDIIMPEMNGLESTTLIRKSNHGDSKIIPIIALTANAFAEDIAKALAAGMNDHISKPIEVDLMFETLAKYLEK